MRFFISIVIMALLIGCTNSQQKQQNFYNNTLTKTVTEVRSLPNASKDRNSENKGYMIEQKNNTKDYNLSDYKLVIYYFYNPDCEACKKIEKKINDIGIRYNGTSVLLLKYNILEPHAFQEYNKFYSSYNLTVKDRVVPIAYVRDKILVGIFDINVSLESLIVNYTK